MTDSPQLAALRLEMNRWQKVAELFSGASFQFPLVHAEEAIGKVREAQGYLDWAAKNAADAETAFAALRTVEQPEAVVESAGPVPILELAKPANTETH